MKYCTIENVLIKMKLIKKYFYFLFTKKKRKCIKHLCLNIDGTNNFMEKMIYI